MKDTDNKMKTLFHRAVYWLSYNKALLFMIYIAVMVFSSSLIAIRNGEDNPKVQESCCLNKAGTGRVDRSRSPQAAVGASALAVPSSDDTCVMNSSV